MGRKKKTHKDGEEDKRYTKIRRRRKDTQRYGTRKMDAEI